MRPDSRDLEQSQIFRYVIASGEMRFIEREERRVHLSNQSNKGLIVWGDIPGCGESCDADLSLLLLEHCMSCEGCEDPEKLSHAFSTAIGKALSAEITRRHPDLQAHALSREAMKVLTNSIRVSEQQGKFEGDQFRFAVCPLCDSARASGVVRDLDLVHSAFFDVVEEILQALDVNTEIEKVPVLIHEDHPLQFTLRDQTSD
jgi:hypothetical protein